MARPRGREKHVAGPAKTVEKRGEGLGTGPVGAGRSGQGSGGSGTRSGGGRPGGGMMKIILLLAVLLLGGGGGLGALLGGGGQTGGAGQTPQISQTVSSGQTGGTDFSSLFGALGNVSGGWEGQANTGRLNESVDPAARPKRVQLLGGGKDTATIMVYMCGTDLESRSGMGTSDLQEMLGADLGKNINLLVYTGGCSGWRNNQISSKTNQIWQIKNGTMTCLEKNLGAVPMTDPSTLSGYIRYCADRFPASRYELILWDHGGGSVSGYGYDEKFVSSGSMNLAGIRSALESAGVTFDFIGFDACLMATAENALTLTPFADYLIASEETEPGVGWYYTNWLTDFGKNPSMPTIEIGRKIADDFVDVCAQKCRGQLTTLSVIDLAELEATLPERLADFSKAASQLIAAKEYQSLSAARGNSREFAQSSKIDHVDLVHLAKNLNTAESRALADSLLSAVKYNRTSSNMTNAFGVSIYFPYKKVSGVGQAVNAYRQAGMDESYIRCIQQFASIEASGQAASGGTASPLPSLMGSLGGSGSDAIAQLLGSFLEGQLTAIAGLDRSNSAFLEENPLSREETVQYLTDNRFDSESLVWTSGEDGTPILRLSEEQWGLVHSLDLNLFYDDGEGFIDLGLDNVFDFDNSGNLLGNAENTWLAVNGQPVAYYHESTVDDGEHNTITGYVPVLHNGLRAELLLAFDGENPYGYVSGIRTVYREEETGTVAKSGTVLEEGDTLEFLCDYYGYDGGYQDSYLLGEPLTVTAEGLTISDVPLEGTVQACYRFTDLYQQSYWTPPIP